MTDFLPLIPKTFDNTIMHQCEKRLIKISECERSCERGRSNKSTNRRWENSRDTYRYASDDGDKHKSPERMMSFSLITGLTDLPLWHSVIGISGSVTRNDIKTALSKKHLAGSQYWLWDVTRLHQSHTNELKNENGGHKCCEKSPYLSVIAK